MWRPGVSPLRLRALPGDLPEARLMVGLPEESHLSSWHIGET